MRPRTSAGVLAFCVALSVASCLYAGADFAKNPWYRKVTDTGTGTNTGAMSPRDTKKFAIGGTRYVLRWNVTRNSSREFSSRDPIGDTRACVRICCKPGHAFDGNACQPTNFSGSWLFQPTWDSHLDRSEKTLRDYRHVYGPPCRPRGGNDSVPYGLPSGPEPASFHVFENGSLLLKSVSVISKSLDYPQTVDSYCLTPVAVEGDIVEVSVGVFTCAYLDKGPSLYPICMLFSVPFLLATIFVYSFLEELNNLPGKALSCHLAALCVAYLAEGSSQLLSHKWSVYPRVCVVLAFIIHFSFLASFFWLNVMCFDIWWTFGGFRSLQGSVKQRERKKFLMYSIYAWGCATTLTVICAIMDYAPSVPDHFIKPGFGSDSCWFKSNAARAIYFYGPMGVTVLCNICLFISTALKIVRHKKDTAHQLKGSESRRHDDNKQWFNLYLKLFIVMGINWSMEIISWLLKDKLDYLWYITDLMNTLQGLIIFIIFVWKDKIKRLLLRRFGCQGRNVLSRNSTRSACNSSSSRTCTTLAPLQEKSNPFAVFFFKQKTAYDESDGV